MMVFLDILKLAIILRKSNATAVQLNSQIGPSAEIWDDRSLL